MSQGELHALGLSLFVPRATVEASPFRFVVIDDPVQAMDPAKVDGLARVLATIANTRQVVVFTHDDRLPESTRRLGLPATVVQVDRAVRSVVDLRVSADPVRRALSDARALAKDPKLPDALRGELVATACRSALEAASHAVIRRRRIGRGEPYADVEALILDAKRTHAQLTLAVFDDPLRGGDLFDRLRREGPSGAVDTLQACKQGAHRSGADQSTLLKDTERLCGWLAGLS